jgi:predicted phosphodiesterase
MLARHKAASIGSVRWARQLRRLHQSPEVRGRAYADRFNDNRMEKKPLDQRGMIAALEHAGFRVSKAMPHEARVRIDGKPGTHYKCAVVCCTHLGNVAQQLSHLHEFYKYAESKGYEDFWNAGDTTDGPDSMHRDAFHEHFVHSFDEVVEYWVKNYPRANNGKTRVILGNHDEAWLKDPSGSNIGQRLADKRPDVEYVGRRAADVRVGGVRIYMLHGAGAPSYARSYKPQRIVEAIPPARRPDILLAGNWHVPAHVPSYIGVELFMLPSFEATTPFITAIGKESVIGGLLLDLELGRSGLRDIKVEWRLYDKAIRGDYPK